jgi:hypothetical protein
VLDSQGSGAEWSVPYMARIGSSPNHGRAWVTCSAVASAMRVGSAMSPAALP